jgi:hypothetical protein
MLLKKVFIKYQSLEMLMICLICFILFCERDFSSIIIQNQNEGGNVHGHSIVTLQNQSEHSGIMVKLVELDTFVITDSSGNFEFPKLRDGNYTLMAKYPYFSTKLLNIIVVDSTVQTKVQIELKQQFQFWIEPSETTMSKSNMNNSNFFLISGLKQYRVNITDSALNVRSELDPLNYYAFYPEGFNWPFIPNPDSLPDFCFINYGWIGSNDAFHDINLSFQPDDTSWVPIPQGILSKNCFYQGSYKFFSSVTDTYHYPEYFNPAYVRNQKNPNQELYDQMNRSLYKKLQLFRPAMLDIIN